MFLDLTLHTSACTAAIEMLNQVFTLYLSFNKYKMMKQLIHDSETNNQKLF